MSRIFLVFIIGFIKQHDASLLNIQSSILPSFGGVSSNNYRCSCSNGMNQFPFDITQDKWDLFNYLFLNPSFGMPIGSMSSQTSLFPHALPPITDGFRQICSSVPFPGHNMLSGITDMLLRNNMIPNMLQSGNPFQNLQSNFWQSRLSSPPLSSMVQNGLSSLSLVGGAPMLYSGLNVNAPTSTTKATSVIARSNLPTLRANLPGSSSMDNKQGQRTNNPPPLPIPTVPPPGYQPNQFTGYAQAYGGYNGGNQMPAGSQPYQGVKDGSNMAQQNTNGYLVNPTSTEVTGYQNNPQ